MRRLLPTPSNRFSRPRKSGVVRASGCRWSTVLLLNPEALYGSKVKWARGPPSSSGCRRPPRRYPKRPENSVSRPRLPGVTSDCSPCQARSAVAQTSRLQSVLVSVNQHPTGTPRTFTLTHYSDQKIAPWAGAQSAPIGTPPLRQIRGPAQHLKPVSRWGFRLGAETLSPRIQTLRGILTKFGPIAPAPLPPARPPTPEERDPTIRPRFRRFHWAPKFASGVPSGFSLTRTTPSASSLPSSRSEP